MNWIKNGPDVEKPKGDCVIRIGRNGHYYAYYCPHVQKWFAGDYNTADEVFADSEVTHFAVITEPDDG